MEIVKISLGGVYFMDLKKMKLDFKDPATICVLAGSVLMLLASFLPQAKAKVSMFGVSESTTSTLMGDYAHQGIFLLLLAIATVVILVLGLDKEKFLSGALGASAAFGLWGMINVIKDVSDAKKEIKGYEDMMSVSYQIGFFLLILGLIAVIGAIVLTTMGAKKQKAAPAQPQVPQV